MGNAVVRLVIVDGPFGGIQAVRQWDNIGELPAGEYFLSLAEPSCDMAKLVAAAEVIAPWLSASLHDEDPACKEFKVAAAAFLEALQPREATP